MINYTRHSAKLVALMKQVAALEIRSTDLYQKLARYIHEDQEAHREAAQACTWLAATQEDAQHFNDVEQWLQNLPQPVAVNKTAILNHKNHRPASFDSLIKQLQFIEQGAIRSYAQICQLTLEQDYKAFDLAYRNMQENIVHLDGVLELADSTRQAHYAY